MPCITNFIRQPPRDKRTALTILIIETHTVKPKVMYENGEEGCVGINKVEPDDNFEAPKGNKVCCKVSGACYDATVLEVYIKTSAKGSTEKYNLVKFPKEEFRCPTGCFWQKSVLEHAGVTCS